MGGGQRVLAAPCLTDRRRSTACCESKLGGLQRPRGLVLFVADGRGVELQPRYRGRCARCGAGHRGGRASRAHYRSITRPANRCAIRSFHLQPFPTQQHAHLVPRLLELGSWRTGTSPACRRKLAHPDISSWFVLLVIEEERGRLSQQELADRLLLDKVSMTRALDHLGEKGLVERCACAGDKRRKYPVKLTPRARPAVKAVRAAYEELNDEALAEPAQGRPRQLPWHGVDRRGGQPSARRPARRRDPQTRTRLMRLDR